MAKGSAYVMDAHSAIELARRRRKGPVDNYEFYAPTLLRSQVLSVLHAELLAKNGNPEEMLQLAERACRLPRRLLGDGVLRATAWQLATEHGWPETYHAEYIALTVLHGKALITGDDELRTRASAIVPTETIADFLALTERE